MILGSCGWLPQPVQAQEWKIEQSEMEMRNMRHVSTHRQTRTVCVGTTRLLFRILIDWVSTWLLSVSADLNSNLEEKRV